MKLPAVNIFGTRKRQVSLLWSEVEEVDGHREPWFLHYFHSDGDGNAHTAIVVALTFLGGLGLMTWVFIRAFI